MGLSQAHTYLAVYMVDSMMKVPPKARSLRKKKQIQGNEARCSLRFIPRGEYKNMHACLAVSRQAVGFEV